MRTLPAILAALVVTAAGAARADAVDALRGFVRDAKSGKAAFTQTVTAPDGTVVESDTWDTSSGVAINQDLVVCGFTIPVGPFAGHTAEFTGFFVP